MHMRNEEVLQRKEVRKKLLLTVRKKQRKFMEHLMRKEGLNNLTFTEYITKQESPSREKQITYLISVSEQTAVQG